MALILHAGAKQVDFGQLADIPTPLPTQTHFPIPHHEFVNLVKQQLVDRGLSITNEAHGVSATGSRYFGTIDVQNGHNNGSYAIIMGLRNSHDKSFPAGLAAGSRVFVCDNLAFSAEVVIRRKHTRFIMNHLPGLIESAVARVGKFWKNQELRYASYREHALTDNDVKVLTVDAMRNEVIPNQLIPRVLEHWYDPEHAEFQPRNAWSFFNAVTSTLRDSTKDPNVLTKRTVGLHALLDNVCPDSQEQWDS